MGDLGFRLKVSIFPPGASSSKTKRSKCNNPPPFLSQKLEQSKGSLLGVTCGPAYVNRDRPPPMALGAQFWPRIKVIILLVVRLPFHIRVLVLGLSEVSWSSCSGESLPSFWSRMVGTDKLSSISRWASVALFKFSFKFLWVGFSGKWRCQVVDYKLFLPTTYGWKFWLAFLKLANIRPYWPDETCPRFYVSRITELKF